MLMFPREYLSARDIMNLDEPPLRSSARIGEELVFERMGTRAVAVRPLLRLRDFVTGTRD